MKSFILTAALAMSFAASSQTVQFHTTKDFLKKDHTHWISIVNFRYYGFVDDTGKEIVPPVYEEIEPFGEYKNDWARVAKDGFYGFINDKGEVIVEPIYEEIGKFGIYKDDWALVTREGFYGFINKEGKEIVEAKYSEVPPIKRQ